MKFFCIFFVFFLLIDNCFSQDTPRLIQISNIPADGIPLDRGWKFKVGDDPDYATPSYDDNAWQYINPTLDIHDSLSQIPRSGICWFRIHLSIESAKQLVMMIQQSGASEIYLDGKLIHHFGILSNDLKKIRAYNPLKELVSFPVPTGMNVVLAVRYGLQPGISYTTLFGIENSGLKITLNAIDSAVHYYRKTHILNEKKLVFESGVFFLLAILYLAFYLFYRAKKVNLYFSIYAFGMGIFCMIDLFCHVSGNVEWWFPLRNFMDIESVFANMMLLTAVYGLFQVKRGWFYYLILILGIIEILAGFFIYNAWEVPALIFSNLISFDITRIGFKSILQNKKGAWIIAAGGIGFFIFWAVFTFQRLGYLPLYAVDFFLLAVFSIPIAVSIYLGYDFALMNRSLQQKLAEVNTLSEEKQQILSSQNETLERQVAQRTQELKRSLEELKATQAQLIQSEKMASLGELTAGIAHEIQNPLNFVNNFSDVNRELADELEQEIDEGKYLDAKATARNIKDNEEKINHHGKRADAIVKGMLQHSRTSSGQNESTDINVLVDEYLRLAYHGFRAKEKSFNAEIKTEFDNSVGRIIIIPQEISRVILNLINNAFYAVNEKQKQNLDDYEPLVTVSTVKQNGKVEIKVKDNGNGISQKIVDKIFQPFFTTKPTGQGTGLGLSLAYDIVKAQGGEIKVESKEGEGAEFILQLSLI